MCNIEYMLFSRRQICRFSLFIWSSFLFRKSKHTASNTFSKTTFLGIFNLSKFKHFLTHIPPLQNPQKADKIFDYRLDFLPTGMKANETFRQTAYFHEFFDHNTSTPGKLLFFYHCTCYSINPGLPHLICRPGTDHSAIGWNSTFPSLYPQFFPSIVNFRLLCSMRRKPKYHMLRFFPSETVHGSPVTIKSLQLTSPPNIIQLCVFIAWRANILR